MTTTLVLPEPIAAELKEAADHPLETAGVLLVSVVEHAAGVRLLARTVRWVEGSAFAQREADSLSILSSGYVPALAEAERSGASAIWLHTHPGVGASPLPSRHDRIVDRQLAEPFRIRTGSPYYLSLIVSPTERGVAFTGEISKEGEIPRALDRLWIVGDDLRMVGAWGTNREGLSPVFDRHVRAFGPAVQATLGQLRIGVVGCGGTGSSVAEQLVRLGVRHLTLIDPENISGSNVTRVYGSTPASVGQPKVEVLGRHLQSIAPDATISRLKSSILVENTARSLVGCDVVFGCTDDNAGRLVLSRLATYFALPVIDCGVLLTADGDGCLVGIHGRVTTLVPGQACLVCRGRIDLSRAAAEAFTPEERVTRADEGYAPALGPVEPAVVTFTSSVGAAAVSELLERLVGYGPHPRPSEVLLRLHDREISTNRCSPRDRHYCSASAGKIGIGSTRPFLDQVWLA